MSKIKVSQKLSLIGKTKKQIACVKGLGLRIINDSKSTSFSSSINLLKNFNRIFWILGGLPKKGDKFKFQNKNKIRKIYIYGKNKSFFI